MGRKPKRRGVKGIYIADSSCCTVETNILQSNYIPIKTDLKSPRSSCHDEWGLLIRVLSLWAQIVWFDSEVKSPSSKVWSVWRQHQTCKRLRTGLDKWEALNSGAYVLLSLVCWVHWIFIVAVGFLWSHCEGLSLWFLSLRSTGSRARGLQ